MEKIQGKLMAKFFFKLKKSLFLALFLAHFPNFGGQKKFSQKIWHAQLDKVF